MDTPGYSFRKNIMYYLFILIQCHIILVDSNDKISVRNCDFKSGNLINCGFIGVSLSDPDNVDKISAYKYDMNIEISNENCSLGTSCAAIDDISFCLNILSTAINKIEYQTAEENEAVFTYPESYSSYFEDVYRLSININYNKSEHIDGYICLPSEYYNISNGNTSLCNNIHEKEVEIKIPIRPNTNGTVSLKDLFFHDRDLILDSLSYTSSEFSKSLAALSAHSNDITYLDVSDNNNGNYVKDITKILVKLSFNNLKFLNVKNCDVKQFPAGFFTTMSQLEILVMSKNNLYGVPDGIGVLKTLKYLDISYQRLHYVIVPDPETISFELNVWELNQLISLRTLNISGLALPNINRYTLPKLPNLEHLILEFNYNNLNNIHLVDDTFEDLPSLKELSFLANQIDYIEPNTFYPLKNLTQLDLTANRELSVRNNLSLNVNNIDNLHLVGNKIKNIPFIITSGHVKNLDLTDNFINEVPTNYSFKNDNFTILNLNISKNNISEITKEEGETLNTLHSVDLGGNPFNCKLCSLRDFQNWLKTTSTIVYNIGTKDPLKCTNEDQKDVDVIDANYNTDLCVPPSLILTVGVPILVVMLFMATSGTLIYVFRFELAHIQQMWRMKRRNELQDRSEGCKFDVYVSHCDADSQWVNEVLIPALEEPLEVAHKYRLCLHDRDFSAGSDVLENIEEGVENSRRVLFVLSRSFVEDPLCQWCLRRYHYRMTNSHDFLILLEIERLSRDALPINLRLLMGSRTYLEWPATPADDRAIAGFWERLRTALGAPLELPTVMNEEEFPHQEDQSLDLICP